MLTACPNELPNPHKDCLHGYLNALICYYNTYERLSVELKRLQQEYKQEVDKVVFHCSEARKLGTCVSEERLKEFQKNIENIDVTNECYIKRIDDIVKEREKLVETARICLRDMRLERCRLKSFQEKTIDHLKAVIVRSDDPIVIHNCQRDIHELNNRFVREVAFLKKCDNILQPFFKMLHDCDSQLICDCLFKEYEWMPTGKSSNVVDCIAEEIKTTMGSTLKRAFAQVHIQKPTDVRKFLSAYIMNVERNEETMKAKLRLFDLNK